MKTHAYADVFPMMGREDSERLVEDIRRRGFDKRFPIVTYEGMILDGRNRWECVSRLREALSAGDAELPEGVDIEPSIVEYEGGDPLGFVISANLSRRHLNASQRALVAERLATMRQGERTDLGSNEPRLSVDDAASLLNVGRETVKRAREVKRSAPDLVPAVERGEMSVSRAAKVARERKPPKKPPTNAKKPDTKTIADFVDERGLLAWVAGKDAKARARVATSLRSLAERLESRK